MDNLFSKLNLKSFKIASIIVLTISDFLVSAFIILRFTSNPNLFQKSMEIVLAQQPELGANLPPDFHNQLYMLLLNSIKIMIVLYILYHLLIYFLWHIEKRAAAKYIQIICWLGAPFALIYALIYTLQTPMFGFFALFVGLSYLFVALGMRHFPESLVPKKVVK